MTQTPMTTREAVKEALMCMRIVRQEDIDACNTVSQNIVENAMRILCEQYGLRLTDYFTDA